MSATRVHVVHETEDDPPHLHDQTLNVGELRALLEYKFTDQYGVEAQIPLKLTNTGIVYRRLDGTVFTPDYGDIHHRNETLFGFGDPWLRAVADLDLAGTSASLKAGVTFPVGRTEENPFELGDRGLRHQHIQFGTGTFNPVLSAVLSDRPWRDVEISLYALGILVLYENKHGYRAGNRYQAGLVVGVDLTDWLTLSVGTDLNSEKPDRWDGEVKTDGNLGRTDLLIGAAAVFRVGGLDVALSLRVPAYVHVIMSEHEPGTVTYPGLLDVSIGKTFSLF